MISVELYRVFYVTAQEKSFSKAAMKLYVTQPSVSHSIKQLEEALQLQLFIRTPKGVSMTNEGKALFHFIEQAFSLIDSGERKVTEMRELQAGSVTIGGSDSICKHVLLPSIQSFQHLYPDIRIKLQHGSTPTIIEKLTSGIIDFGFIHLPIHDQQIEVTEILSSRNIFVVGEKYKALSEEVAILKDLLQYPIISFSETSSSRRFLNDLFQKQGFIVKPDIEVGSVDLIIECAKIGMGIAFVAKEYVTQELDKQTLFEVKLEEKIVNRKIGLVKMKELPLSVAASAFYQHLLQKA
ncbi:LysR family transcriptional regulator [Bacillus spongiae]|uniref:LysR family transcriptional regulator n=1 Tax=Bacillus spongiae TaxID=2683610 RepID=A0ABU8HHK3_9BACI